MFKFVKAILDKSKEMDVDILVAKAMVLRDYPDSLEVINAAYNIIDKYYDEITAFRRDGTDDNIKELVELVESGDTDNLTKYLKENKQFFDDSYKKATENN